MIITSQCEKCKYGDIDYNNQKTLKIYCELKNKYYYFGQCIPCEHFTKYETDDFDNNEE